jgi:hypothetical protein
MLPRSTVSTVITADVKKLFQYQRSMSPAFSTLRNASSVGL